MTVTMTPITFWSWRAVLPPPSGHIEHADNKFLWNVCEVLPVYAAISLLFASCCVLLYSTIIQLSAQEIRKNLLFWQLYNSIIYCNIQILTYFWTLPTTGM
jgi:hypothetical protein